MELEICACELSYTCERHTEENDRMMWPAVLGLKPTPQDAWDAYDSTYKGKFWEGWS